MENKNYLMIKENIVINICLWDGDVNTWTPPSDVVMLLQETTPTKVWKINQEHTEYVLTDSIGDAQIDFTYENAICITNQEKPSAEGLPLPVTTIE